MTFDAATHIAGWSKNAFSRRTNGRPTDVQSVANSDRRLIENGLCKCDRYSSILEPKSMKPITSFSHHSY